MKNAGLFVILIFRRKGFGKSACFLLAGLESALADIRGLNTSAPVIQLAAVKGDGLGAWFDWLRISVAKKRAALK